MSTAGERLLEIDALKVAGIATVVLIHTLRAPWDPAVAPLEVWIGHATRFGVPAFLFASGFLYATTAPVPGSTTAGRLRRILVPYLLASLAAQGFRRALELPEETGSILLDFLIGSSFGPYYYVFVIACLVVATPLFARLPRAAVGAAVLVLVAAQWLTDAGPLGMLELRWHLRNPLLWWAHFLLGWWVCLQLPDVRRVIAARGAALAAALALAVLALTAASALEGRAPRLLVRSAAWLDIYAILGLIFVLASRAGGGGERVPAWLRFVSDATYPIYLFHLFFLIPAQRLLPPPAGSVAWQAILLPWACGLAGPLVLVAASRALLGSRSRGLLGA